MGVPLKAVPATAVAAGGIPAGHGLAPGPAKHAFPPAPRHAFPAAPSPATGEHTLGRRPRSTRPESMSAPRAFQRTPAGVHGRKPAGRDTQPPRSGAANLLARPGGLGPQAPEPFRRRPGSGPSVFRLTPPDALGTPTFRRPRPVGGNGPCPRRMPGPRRRPSSPKPPHGRPGGRLPADLRRHPACDGPATAEFPL